LSHVDREGYRDPIVLNQAASGLILVAVEAILCWLINVNSAGTCRFGLHLLKPLNLYLQGGAGAVVVGVFHDDERFILVNRVLVVIKPALIERIVKFEADANGIAANAAIIRDNCASVVCTIHGEGAFC